MKQCTDKEYELIQLLKGQPQTFDKEISAKVLHLMDDIRRFDDPELKKEPEVCDCKRIGATVYVTTINGRRHCNACGEELIF